MGETTCFMQPFSYASGGLPGDQHHLEENPMHALTQSISFGRFVSDSASWDRWSVFPSNRYVEEAEKFSRPGSVAQKKAFFEAHYKKMAARKAAALLEQANAASTDSMKSDGESGVPNDRSSKESPANRNDKKNSEVFESKDDDNDRDELLHVALQSDVNGLCSEVEKVESEKTGKTENSLNGSDQAADLLIEEKILREGTAKDGPLNQFSGSNRCDEAADEEWSGSPEIEKPLLKDFIREEVSEVTDLNKPVIDCSKMLGNQKAAGITASPAMATTTPLPYRKGKNATPKGRNFEGPSDIRRPTPKRLPLGNLSPVREINKGTISWSMGNPKTSTGPSKARKDCQTPLRTPTMAPANVTSKYTLTTPKSDNKRTPFGDGKQTGSKRRSLAKECSKFLSACKNRLQSPSLSTPFRLRTEERAARRKEKLEEKFNADEREKIQLQNILKEKQEMEVKKFRQTLCFKARPLPKFYRENTAAKTQVKKVELNCSESSKRARKSWNTTLPNRFTPQLQGKKPALEILHRNPARENRSPNIQQ